MWAAFNSHTGIVRLLLEHGADANLVDYVSAACVGPAHGWWLQRLILTQCLFCSIHFFTCCMPACVILHAPRVVRQGRQAALMHAASNGHTDIVRLLLEHGAAVNLVGNVSAACGRPARGWWLQRLILTQ